MYKAVVDAGISEYLIVVDPAGVDTYDSMRRAKEFYKLDRVLIFSQ
jgi:vancomycin permeability regulator SanA